MDNEKMDVGEEGHSLFDDEPHWVDICAAVVWFVGRLAFAAMAFGVLLLATSVFFQAVLRPILIARGWCV